MGLQQDDESHKGAVDMRDAAHFQPHVLP
jgi:hypothetical protein